MRCLCASETFGHFKVLYIYIYFITLEIRFRVFICETFINFPKFPRCLNIINITYYLKHIRE